MIPLTVPGTGRLLPPATALCRRAMAGLAAPPPGPLSLVAPARPGLLACP